MWRSDPADRRPEPPLAGARSRAARTAATLNRLRRVAAAWIVLAIAGLTGLGAELRSIHFDRYTLDEGLSQQAVNAIVQDEHGFIWLATQEGLNRFDGFTFEHIGGHEDEDSPLPDSWVWTLFVDSKGTLWVGTDGGGLSRWDPLTESFENFQLDSSNPTTLSNNTVRALYEDSGGRLWVGTDGGLNLLVEEALGTFRRYNYNPTKPHSLSADSVRAILEDSQGVLWVGTHGGLNRLDPEEGGFVQYRHDPNDSTSLSDNEVRSIYEDRAGNLWIGTENAGLNRMNRETGTFVRFDAPDGSEPGGSQNPVRWMLEDRDGTLWIGTGDGLYEWISQTDRFQRYEHNPTDSSSLAGNSVMSIFQDAGGVLWVGTMTGLSKWNPTTSTFGAFTAGDAEGHRLSSNAVYSLAEGTDGDIWVGTYGGGLNRLNQQTGRISHYRHDPRNPRSLGDDNTPTLFVDSQDRLWVGTISAGLFRHHGRRDDFTNYRADENDPNSLSGNAVTSIYEDSEGTFWIGTFGHGLNQFDPATGRAVSFRFDGSVPTSISSDNVLVIEEDSLGVLWIGTHGGGLSGLDRETGHFMRIGAKALEDGTSLSDRIWSLLEDRDGNLWIGTQDDGLYRWSRDDRSNYRQRFRHYNHLNGLPSGGINGILEDHHGNLWLSTTNGIARLDPVDGSVRVIDRSNGLLSNEFNQGAHLRTRSGVMFFGGSQGVNSFHPDRLATNSHRPPVVLTSLLKNNEPGSLDRPLPEVDEIVLEHTDHVVSFEFASLDYTAPDKNEYAYKLVGFDKEWVQANNYRFASYTNLDAGNYTFRVKASNNDGLWNEDGLSIAIRVLPPPWQTWWAYAFYALVLVSIVVSYARMQSRKLEKEADYSRKLRREVQARTAELAERNSDLEQANNKLQQASFTDSLTGLRNRRYLMSTISDDIALVDRHYRDLAEGGSELEAQRPDFLFLIFDLDGFKEVNDTFGHAAGDQVLVQVRDLLERACRSSDTVIRWGGDEFLVVGRYADRRAAEILSDRIRTSVDQHAFVLGNGMEAKLSCSIGFAYYPFARTSPRLLNWEQVVAVADRALYIAKNSGRNAWVGIQETPKTADLAPEALAQQVHDRVDRLVADGYLALHSSIDDEQELVWAWG